MFNSLKILECPICLTSFKTTGRAILPCNCVCCQTCLNDWISLKINEPSFTLKKNIPCFNRQCRGTCQIQSICHRLPKLVRDKVSQELLNYYLTRTADIRKCPNINCSYAGIINLSQRCSKPLKCEACETTWRDPVHFTATEKILAIMKGTEVQKNEAFSSIWKTLWAKKCPSCQVLIQKNGGCSHMNCSLCGLSFCWTCNGRHYEPKHLLYFWLSALPIIVGILSVLYFIYQIPIVNAIVDSGVDHIVRFGQYIMPYCWAVIKFLAVILLNSILTNAIFIFTYCIYERLKKGTQKNQFHPLELVMMIIVVCAIGYYFELYYKMAIIGLIEAPIILVNAYLTRKDEKQVNDIRSNPSRRRNRHKKSKKTKVSREARQIDDALVMMQEVSWRKF